MYDSLFSPSYFEALRSCPGNRAVVNPMLARWARVPSKRIRRREFSVLRNPQATRLTCLTSRLQPSVQALVSPVCRNAGIAEHHF